jgi:urease accessory protein
MAIEPGELLLALQHGDSFFPGGAVSFSWGLEALYRDGEISDADAVMRLAAGQLRSRWAAFDRPVLLHAHGLAGDGAALRHLDHLVEALTLAREFRDGSRRMGAALLAVHSRLGTEGAEDYRGSVMRGEAHGHLAVVQGLVWRSVGLGEHSVQAAAAHGFCVGLLGAAIRLGLIGHIASQHCLRAMRETIRDILATPPAPLDEIGAFAPHIDAAAMRHEVQSIRLFAN